MYKLKKYDRFLSQKHELDGTISIYRKSPFNSLRNHEILKIQNQYPGSWSWILKRLILMDTQRFDIINKSILNNKRLREQHEDERVTRDIADFWESGGDSIVV